MIIQQAKEMARSRDLNDFQGSTSWRERFMKRNGLSMRTRTSLCQKMPEEYEDKVLEFHRYVIRARKEAPAGDYELNQPNLT